MSLGEHVSVFRLNSVKKTTGNTARRKNKKGETLGILIQSFEKEEVEEEGVFWRLIKNLPFKGYSLLLLRLMSYCELAKTLEGEEINKRIVPVRSKNNLHTYIIVKMNILTFLLKTHTRHPPHHNICISLHRCVI